jgi:hypothetical protein
MRPASKKLFFFEEVDSVGEVEASASSENNVQRSKVPL